MNGRGRPAQAPPAPTRSHHRTGDRERDADLIREAYEHATGARAPLYDELAAPRVDTCLDALRRLLADLGEPTEPGESPAPPSKTTAHCGEKICAERIHELAIEVGYDPARLA